MFFCQTQLSYLIILHFICFPRPINYKMVEFEKLYILFHFNMIVDELLQRSMYFVLLRSGAKSVQNILLH
jgi:hypothetical protein